MHGEKRSGRCPIVQLVTAIIAIDFISDLSNWLMDMTLKPAKIAGRQRVSCYIAIEHDHRNSEFSH